MRWDCLRGLPSLRDGAVAGVKVRASSRGPLRSLLELGCAVAVVVVCFRLAVGLPPPSRVPARRPGNFFLLAQKKVTKKEGLNTDLAVPSGYAVRRAAWSRCLPSHHRLGVVDQRAVPGVVFGIRSASDRNTSAKSARWGTPVHGRPPDRVAEARRPNRIRPFALVTFIWASK